MKITEKKFTLSIIILFVLGVLYLFATVDRPTGNLGSVSVSNEYQATTSNPNQPLSVNQIIKAGPATLGSVIVTTAGAAGGHLSFYNATTSDSTKRESKYSTSTQLRVALPNNLVAGTYTFDIDFPIGLVVVYTGTAGAQASTTITYR